MKPLALWWSRNLPKITLLLLIATFAGTVYVFITTNANERTIRAQSVQITETLSDLREIVRVGVDAETGARGYVLTEDKEFLEPYNQAYRIWLSDIDELQAKFEKAGEEEDAVAVGQIRSLAEKKLQFIDQIVTLTAQGQRDQAIRETETKYGKLLLDNIRDAVNRLEMKQQRKLAETIGRADNIQIGVFAILMTSLLLVVALAYFSFVQERRASRVALLDQQATLLRQGKEQADLVAQELNHRVKNLFAVILSLVTLSARGSKDVPETVERIRNRIHALSLAHSVSQGTGGISSVDLKELLTATLAPYRNAANVIIDDGGSVSLPVGAMTPLGLVVHELATNALKYGALSTADGMLKISWEKCGSAISPEVRITWREFGFYGTKPKDSKGFGSKMISASTQQLKGRVEQRWLDDGMELCLQFPVS
ncbi:sensor histidine kinase [Sphingorhabdus sp.]|uniref:sensor histidine kinase n=1 Tax=Sphingorhabdus sp. TaxID=1902408 RepID=UPI0039191982